MVEKDIEIKKVEAKEVVVSTKRTLYCCVYWDSNGVMFSNSPTYDKRCQEDYALSMSKHMEHTCVYSFDIDIPIFKTQQHEPKK